MPAIRQKVVAPLILSFLQPRLRRPTHSLKEEEGAPLFFFAINSSFLCSYAVGFHWEGETFSEDHGFFRCHRGQERASELNLDHVIGTLRGKACSRVDR